MTLSPDSEAYPKRLHKLFDPPKLLFVRGNLPDFNQPVIAVVGSRRASVYGRWVAEHLVGELAAAGVHILSGLALGIDGLSHAATMSRGGLTSAVLPSGLDQIYPASHHQLAQSIISSGGGLISEYSAGTRAAPYHFPARNRIVAALADAVLVIEAGYKSGTLITAEHALDLGLPVLAVPGPISSPTSEGTNQLIKLGAGLVTSAQDVLHELGIEEVIRGKVQGADAAEQSLLDFLADHPHCSLEELIEGLGWPAAETNRRLTHLELSGAVKSTAGNWTLA